jgi:hypothetical protein
MDTKHTVSKSGGKGVTTRDERLKAALQANMAKRKAWAKAKADEKAKLGKE